MGRAGQLPRVSFASYVVTAAYPNGLQSSFTWDSRHRLTALASPAASYNYALDPVGNRLSETSSLHGLNSGLFNYNADDWQSTETYDANGNVLTTGGKSFGYDSENQLVSMNGGTVGLQYDGDGNRVSETVNGTTTRYLVDDLNPTGYAQVVEELVNGSVQRQYSYGLQRIDENQVINSAWTPSFYGYDGGGNVRQLTNLAGVVTDTYSYDAFGNLLSSTGTTSNHYLYRGEQYDQALNLYYLRARHYNPTTGRFMGRDAADGDFETPASLHKYAYADADPVDGLDPSGRAATLTGLPPTETESAPADKTGRTASEYVSLVFNLAIRAIPPVAAVGCAVSIAYNVIALEVADAEDITPTLRCKARALSRMTIQLQIGTPAKGGKTVTEATRKMVARDPPGVSLRRVTLESDELHDKIEGGLPGFPRSSRSGLDRAIDQVKNCAARIVLSGGVSGGQRNVCQGYFTTNKSDWRIDLDNNAGTNLRQ